MAKIALQVQSNDPNNDALLLSDLVHVLNTIKAALDETQRVFIRGEPPIRYRVVGLRRSSPSTLELEAEAPSSINDNAEELFARFLDGADAIQNRRTMPRDFNVATVSAYREMAKMVDKRVGSLVLTMEEPGPGRRVEVSRRLVDNASALLGPKRYARGSFCGRLERIDVHNQNNVLTVYPITGPRGGIRCRFSSEIAEIAMAGIGKHVDVTGLFIFNAVDTYPQEVKAERLVACEHVEHPSSLVEFWEHPVKMPECLPGDEPLLGWYDEED